MRTATWNAFSTFGSPHITVAVADDGVDVNHPEFVDKIVAQHDFANDAPDGAPKFAIDKHGTACAGVAVAPGIHVRGAAPNCKLMAVRFPDMLGVADEASVMTPWADGHDFERWSYARDVTHVCFYSKPTMPWIADRCGLRLEMPRRDIALFQKSMR